MKNSLPYATFKEYLKAKNLLHASGDVLKEEQKEWKRIYARAYMKSYVKKQINTVFNQSDYIRLKKKASSFKLKVPEYIRHLVKQDSNEQGKIRPHLLVDIEVGILRIIDHMNKELGASIETRSKVLDIVNQLENLLILLG